MKKILNIFTVLLVVFSMINPIQAEATQIEGTNETSFLERIFQEPELSFSDMSLTLQNIDIKGEKDWSGEIAIVYEKTTESVAINDGVKALYNEDQAKWVKRLSKDYTKLSSDMDKKIAILERDMAVPRVKEAAAKVADYIKILNSDSFMTIDMEIQEANMLSQSFAEAFKLDFVNYNPQLRSKIVAIERLKNINLQQIIDALSSARINYESSVKNDIEKEVSLLLEEKFASVLPATKELTFKRVGSNEKELFVVLNFKELKAIHQGFVVVDGTDMSSLTEEQRVLVESIESSYVSTHQQEPEVTAAAEYLLDVINKSQKMMTITLETEGQRLLQSYNQTIDQLIKEKEAAPEILYGPRINTVIRELEQKMTEYQSKSGKIKDDGTQVDKVMELLETYDQQVVKYASEQLSQEQLKDEFKQSKVITATFSQPIPVEIRMTIEGKFVLKYLANGQLDSKTNYYYNMQSSGESAMRLYSEESSFLGFYQPSTVSGKNVKLGFALYVALLAVLFFVKRDWFKNIVIVNLLLVISFIVIYPLAWVIGASLNNSTSLGSVGISPFPKHITFIQYERLFLTTDYGKWFLNSFKIAVSNMFITVSLAVTAAYVFSRFKFKGKKVGLMTMLIIQIFPSFSAMVAIYTLLANVKFLAFLTGETSLVNTHLGLILVYCAGQIPYNTWLVKGYFDTLPMSMDEAARIDGASNMQAFIKIILPLGRPIIAFVAVTSFMAPWMDFILPRLLLKSTEKKTLAVGLFEMINGQSNNNFTMFAAGAVLVAVPITLMYAYFQKYIVKGLASGAVKG